MERKPEDFFLVISCKSDLLGEHMTLFESGRAYEPYAKDYGNELSLNY